MNNSKALITAFAFFIGLMNVQGQVTVATDKNLEAADFNEYKTFTFADHIEDASDNSFFWDSELLKIVAREEIKDELEALGYNYINSPEADFLINFRFFEKETEFTGWTDNYADEHYWGSMEMRKKSIGLTPSPEVREAGDAETYHLDKGSLLIQFADLKKNITVWQGYSSGIIEDTSILDPEKDRIDTAVEMIFDEYNFSAYEH
ncbi:DUF4136 domain-containing protein [Marinilabilia rubra]|uniref:DUF4136 domain-containing protein n=1 Tax=Marinilabilia rubra TaxID=2162893 RepID=A0A2U2BCT6_9BACT|nr:DUF4136 domain-containing protein [Marinilabilia rubra]PWE00879.1 hypothetical protein DDZ16_04640 [Marinilabilia rubra]